MQGHQLAHTSWLCRAPLPAGRPRWSWCAPPSPPAPRSRRQTWSGWRRWATRSSSLRWVLGPRPLHARVRVPRPYVPHAGHMLRPASVCALIQLQRGCSKPAGLHQLPPTATLANRGAGCSLATFASFANLPLSHLLPVSSPAHPPPLQVSAQLFATHRQYHEGQLTKRKELVVANIHLAEAAVRVRSRGPASRGRQCGVCGHVEIT